MRTVVDVNVLLSALFWRGAPHLLLEHARAGTLVLLSSPALLAELADVLGRSKFNNIVASAAASRERMFAEIRQIAEIIEPPPLPAPVCRDPDDAVLALASAAQADMIVSGDSDLLVLRSYAAIPIVDLCHDRLAQALLQTKRGASCAGVLFMDLDRFKSVNDTFGHGAGDLRLFQAGERLTQCLRAGDTVGRLGGDEFLIVLPKVADPRNCGRIAVKAIDALSSAVHAGSA